MSIPIFFVYPKLSPFFNYYDYGKAYCVDDGGVVYNGNAVWDSCGNINSLRPHPMDQIDHII